MNVGSKASRAIHWRNKNKTEFSHNALKRAIDLISLTIETQTIKTHFRELTRLRGEIKDYFYGTNEFSSSDKLWEKYFNHFNYAARRYK